MRKRFSVALILLLLVAASGSYFSRLGFAHVLPASMLRWSRQQWSRGQYSASVRWFLMANASAFNAGWRWFIADLYLDRAKDLQSRNALPGSLDACARAVRILDGHDDEGAVSYYCSTVAEAVRRQP